MTTLTIKIPSKNEKEITEFISQLGGKVIAVDKPAKQSLMSKKEDVLKDLGESVEFVKLHQEGKVKSKTITQLLNEL